MFTRHFDAVLRALDTCRSSIPTVQRCLGPDSPKSEALGRLLGGVLSTETAAVGAVTGFWLANSLNSNRAGAAKDAALSQIAGAGPPPPATPLETTSPPP